MASGWMAAAMARARAATTMATSLWESTELARGMGSGGWCAWMDTCMRESGQAHAWRGMECASIPTVTAMKGIGRRQCGTGGEFRSTTTSGAMTEIGSKTNALALVACTAPTRHRSTRASSRKGSGGARAGRLVSTGQNTSEIGETGSERGGAPRNMPTGRCIEGSGSAGLGMAQGYSRPRTAQDTKGSGVLIGSKATAH
mmetsp:Transcript_33938/g.70056  ORF Transcript_33938/g.70056 Transcript_33938/m.70056 type:complete len:200 (+) Transcript_33938:820-1419(+)